MNIDQMNLVENVNRNVNAKTSKGIAAYQAMMPETEEKGILKKADQLATVSSTGGIKMNDAVYKNPTLGEDEKEKTIAEKVMSESDQSVLQRSNELAVVANTTSPEDLKKISEDGFSITDTDTHTIITVTDKIKATLAQAGEDVSYFGDELSRKQILEMTGSETVTNQIVQSLTAADLPATEQNVEQSVAAITKAATISELSDNAIAYLIKHELEPTIANVVMAQTSTGWSESSEQASNYDSDMLDEQIAAIIEEGGLELTDQTREAARWLIGQEIPLTTENLQYYIQLSNLSQEISEESYDYGSLTESMMRAITSGKRPEDGLMVTTQRKREEARLTMTMESRNSMEKLGISVDTTPIEEHIEQLKVQEKAYYANLLQSSGIEPTEEKVNLFADTMTVFEELKTQPAYVLGKADVQQSVEEIHRTGENLRSSFLSMEQTYEQLQTTPRADLGDRIQKAFRNVDDILTSMELEPTDYNRRAVRILSYNEMEITVSNINQIKQMDSNMQQAFSNMTPAVTLEMIRKNLNPLDITVEKLNTVAEDVKREIGHEDVDRFEKFLWKLEKNQEISEEERSSYIGIYRLIAQIERVDGAVLGNLMEQGQPLTMRNMLTALRSTRKKGSDYKIDDDFEGVKSKTDSPRIDEQIEASFQINETKTVMELISPEKLAVLDRNGWSNQTPEQLAQMLRDMEQTKEEETAETEYARQQLAEVNRVLENTQDIYSYLERYDIPNTIANIMAVSDMIRRPNQVMDRLWKSGAFSKDSREMIADLKEQVLEEFGESLENPSELADAQEKLADVAEHVMDTMIIEDPTARYLDIRQLKQTVNYFQLCAKRTSEECYMVPIQTGDSVTGVSVKIVRGKEKKGYVDILFESHQLGKVAATFKARSSGISGMIATSDEETRKLLSDQLGLFASAIQKDKDEAESLDLSVAYVKDLSLGSYEMNALRQEKRMRENGELEDHRDDMVQTKRLYHIAESFITSIQEISN